MVSILKYLVSELPRSNRTLPFSQLNSVCNFKSNEISAEAVSFIKNNFASILCAAKEKNYTLWLKFAKRIKMHHFRCNHTLVKLQEMYNQFLKNIKNLNESALLDESLHYENFEMHRTNGKSKQNAKHAFLVKENMIHVLFSDFLSLKEIHLQLVKAVNCATYVFNIALAQHIAANAMYVHRFEVQQLWAFVNIKHPNVLVYYNANNDENRLKIMNKIVWNSCIKKLTTYVSKFSNFSTKFRTSKSTAFVETYANIITSIIERACLPFLISLKNDADVANKFKNEIATELANTIRNFLQEEFNYIDIWTEDQTVEEADLLAHEISFLKRIFRKDLKAQKKEKLKKVLNKQNSENSLSENDSSEDCCENELNMISDNMKSFHIHWEPKLAQKKKRDKF